MEFSYMRIVVWRLGTWADTLRRRAWGRSIYNAEMRRWKAYEDQQATECIWTYQRRMTGWEGFTLSICRYYATSLMLRGLAKGAVTDFLAPLFVNG